MKEPELDPAEASILADQRFFEVKARLDVKIRVMMDELQTALENASAPFAGVIPGELKVKKGRFYQGENFNGFPWRAIDHLAHFQGEDSFVFRCLVLYGNHVSVHLLLSGEWQERFADKVQAAAPRLEAQGFVVSLQDSPWDWQYTSTSHSSLSAMLKQDSFVFKERSFLKLSVHYPPDSLNLLPSRAVAAWQTLLPILFPLNTQA